MLEAAPQVLMDVVSKWIRYNSQTYQFIPKPRKVGFQIPRSNDPLANDDQIQDVWVGMSPVEGGGTDTQIQVVYSTGVYVEGLDDVMIRLSRCCTPVPGDEILGFITRGRGVSVHRGDCANAISLSSQTGSSA